jgi:hypothetical protein
MSKEKITLEDSYLLLEFFDNVKRILTYLHTDEVEFEVRPNRKANFAKYRFSYRNEDGEYFEEFITHCLKLGGQEISRDELEKFNKVVAVIEKENVSLKPINKDTTVEEFLKQFSKFHQIAYLNRQLSSELPTNELSKENTKILKL